MEKYGFNFNAMRHRIEYLEDYVLKNKHSLSDVEIKEICISIELIEKLLTDFDSNDISESYNDYESETTNIDLIRQMKEYVELDEFNNCDFICNRNKICELLYKSQFSKHINIDYNPTLSISNEDAVKIVGDMIRKKLGINHYNVYKSLFLNNCDHVHFSDKYNSFLHSAKMDDDVFVIIRDSDDITKVSDVAHEAGHYFARSIKDFSYFSGDTILYEIESTFYELLLLQYLIEENIDRDMAYKLLYSSINDITYEKAAIVFAEYNYPMYKINSVKDFKIMANNYNLYERTGLFSTRDLLNEIILCNQDNIFVYIYSTLIAFELFDDYTVSRNKKNVVLKYEKFVKEIGKIPDFKLSSYINSDNISFNNFKVLKKYNKQCLEHIKNVD